MVKKENSSNTLWVVFISICLGFVIRIYFVLNADQNLFAVFNIDILILFVAIIGLIILLKNKKKNKM
ncbi:hypothetical protein [Peribacillus sp. NPDC096540]|uniref:hypothetical protein n=1 Tax=Peribacillus sp. NPDC096540 TaxID=3390612 RepID=UPI003CFE6FB1